MNSTAGPGTMADVHHSPGPPRPWLIEAESCPVCDGSPTVLVAVRHAAMRDYTCRLLERDYGCWSVARVGADELLVDAIGRTRPDVVVVDWVDFPACCRAALATLPPGRVVVIGPEPDAAY